MRRSRLHAVTVILPVLILVAALPAAAPCAAPTLSGDVTDGLRVIPVDPSASTLRFTVYRGDYIQFKIADPGKALVFSVPALGIEETLPIAPGDMPYFKMKTAGTYPFTLGDARGELVVVDYREDHYRELTAREARDMIAAISPVILDVRTPAEFRSVHLDDALLIPLQELQARVDELSPYKDSDILIYCATGNRSTVASKILIDRGFNRIYNLRHGIVDWQKHKLPVAR
jgi:rhodanese-related sulfurtransferase